MTLIAEPIIGLEQLQRAMLFQIMDRVNPIIDQIEQWMEESDREYAERRGEEFEPTAIERIETKNFVEGHRPSLISAPIDNYPNVACWAVHSSPLPESLTLDHAAAYNAIVVVEVMTKSIKSEEEVNRRTQRTAEAVNIAVMQDTTLGGIITGIVNDPLIQLTEVFTRKERTAYGPHWYWQIAQIQYFVKKEMAYPSSDGSIFHSPAFSIDQA